MHLIFLAGILLALPAHGELAAPHVVSGPTSKPKAQKSSNEEAPSGSGASAALFCQDPFSAICLSGEGASGRLAREQRNLAQRRSVQKAAEQKALSRMGFRPGLRESQAAQYRKELFETQKEPQAKLPPEQAASRNYKMYLEELYRSVGQVVNLRGEGERVRQATLKTINAQNISPERKAAMIQKITGESSSREIASFQGGQQPLKIITSAQELLALAEFDSSRNASGLWVDDLLTDFQTECGLEGMNPNAYYSTRVHAVIFCPGMLVSLPQSGSAGSPPELPLMSMIQVHETGHAIGSNAQGFGGDYVNYQACLMDVGDKDPARNFLPEVTSDYWAAESLAGMMGNDRQSNIRFLIRGAQTLCDSEADGSHPSGRYRIETVLGRNASLLEKMGCPISAARPGCALEGKVSAPRT